ncbi:MAG: tRNA dihydrouridine(20/20a) synthase DusA [Methylococcales bacterium]|nr:tRNA dihydrouridine(20/20a) synthase DusA [Methylococcales bacterium]
MPTNTLKLTSPPPIPATHRFCTAPMLDWTDRHCRYFFRRMTRKALLYTEMVTTGALLHGDRERFLAFHPEEKPLALQLGGSDPEALARCVVMAESAGYDEVNLNVGCPSDRVQNGRFGACLMAEPKRVAECVAAMRERCQIPVTVKTRIGIDTQDDDAFLDRFVSTVAESGCDTFIIHARKAWLNGLSPKENRDIPPLRHDRVLRLKQRFGDLRVVINGGIDTLDQAEALLADLDGVMLGRAAYQNAYILADVDQRLFGAAWPVISRAEVIEAMLPYLAKELAHGTRLSTLIKPLFSLYHGQPGGRRFRRWLSEHGHRRDAGLDVLQEAARLTETTYGLTD